jgi:hypothetical protein
MRGRQPDLRSLSGARGARRRIWVAGSALGLLWLARPVFAEEADTSSLPKVALAERGEAWRSLPITSSTDAPPSRSTYTVGDINGSALLSATTNRLSTLQAWSQGNARSYSLNQPYRISHAAQWDPGMRMFGIARGQGIVVKFEHLIVKGTQKHEIFA